MNNPLTQRDVDIAWLAGFFEGEGTIYVQKTKFKKKDGTTTIHCRLRICLCQNYTEPLNKCKEIFSGFEIRGPYKNNTSKNMHYQCYVTDAKTLEVLKLISPFLSARRLTQIEAAKTEFNQWLSQKGKPNAQ